MHTLGLGFIGVGLCGCVGHRRGAGRAGGAGVQREEFKPLSRAWTLKVFYSPQGCNKKDANPR